MPRFAAFDTSNLRSASSASPLRWLGRSVTLLRVHSTGVVVQAKTDSEKRALLESATSKTGARRLAQPIGAKRSTSWTI